MPPSVARAIIRQLTASYGVVIAEEHRPGGDGVAETWRLVACNAHGERWIAEGDDYGGAVCELARLLGFDLVDS